MKTKEEILFPVHGHCPEELGVVYRHEDVLKAMDEFAEETVLAFEKWLSENTEIIKEDKITLYRYCDKNNEWGNYTLEDIYWVFIDSSPTTVNK